jgi:hypothetical protein
MNNSYVLIEPRFGLEKNTMKQILLTPLLGFLLSTVVYAASPATYEDGRLSNGIIAVVFDEEGGFSIHDAKSTEPLLSKARFGLPRGKRGKIVKMVAEEFEDELGAGRGDCAGRKDRDRQRHLAGTSPMQSAPSSASM